MFLTKEAVFLAVPGFADAVACEGCPPLSRLFEQFAENGGEPLVCPICAKTRKLDEGNLAGNARLAGATPLLHRDSHALAVVHVLSGAVVFEATVVASKGACGHPECRLNGSAS